MARFAGPKAREYGIRIIAPDRPGFGLSDLQPKRHILDWAQDVEELVDFLQIGKFSVAGVSGGAPYVAACAWRLGTRVASAGIISGLAPEERIRKDLSWNYRLLVLIFLRTRLIQPLLELLVWQSLRRPEELLIRSMEVMAYWEDRKILADPEVQSSQLDGMVEALRRGAKGTEIELQLYSRLGL